MRAQRNELRKAKHKRRRSLKPPLIERSQLGQPAAASQSGRTYEAPEEMQQSVVTRAAAAGGLLGRGAQVAPEGALQR